MLNDKNKDTFCPAHWNDIHFAPSQGYLTGCCKSAPLLIDDTEGFKKRKEDSLNGIRNPGCDYCWKTEDAGNESFRHFKVRNWQKREIKDQNDSCTLLTLVLGNLCNFKCTYCNEKYSSKWQTDKKQHGEIEMQFDSDVYYAGATCSNEESQVYIDYFNKMKPTKVLTVSGGEPLMGTVFYDILTECDLSTLKEIRVSTNLNYPNRKTISKLLEFQDTHRIVFSPSLDTIDSNIQEYIRYGFNWKDFKSNLDFLLTETQANITFNTLITAHTVFGIDNMYEFVYNLKNKYPGRINWFAATCVQPKIHSFDILTDEYKELALTKAQLVQAKIYKNQGQVSRTNRVDMELANINKVVSTLQSAEFNEELYKDQKHFFEQVNERQGIKTPEELRFLI